MAIVVTVASATVSPLSDGLRITSTLGVRTVCELQWADAGGSGVHPALGDEVIVTDGATTVFGGIVGTINESGLHSQALADLRREVVAYDYSAYCDQRIVTESYATGATLKTIVADLCTTYLTVFGVTLDGAQANGPTLDAANWEGRTLTEVFTDLQTVTGWYWRISAAKVLTFYEAGTTAAPWSITSSSNRPLTLSWEYTRDRYRNRQYVVAGSAGDREVWDTFTGDSTTRAWALRYPGAGTGIPMLVSEGRSGGWVDYVPGWWPSDPQRWLYSSTGSSTGGTDYGSIVQATTGVVLSTVDGLKVKRLVTWPVTFSAETTAAPVNPYEAIAVAPDCYDVDSAVAIANGLLTEFAEAKRVTFTTRTAGLDVGQSVTITLADRHLSGAHLIAGLTVGQYPGVVNALLYTVECVSGVRPGGAWLDTYKQWSGSATVAAGSVYATPAPSVATAALHAHLGGSRTELIATTAWTPVVGYQSFTAPATGIYTFYTERAAETTAVTVQVRFFSVTSSEVVAGSLSTASASTAWVAATASLSLEAGHQYRPDVLGDSATLGTYVGQVTIKL